MVRRGSGAQQEVWESLPSRRCSVTEWRRDRGRPQSEASTEDEEVGQSKQKHVAMGQENKAGGARDRQHQSGWDTSPGTRSVAGTSTRQCEFPRMEGMKRHQRSRAALRLAQRHESVRQALKRSEVRGVAQYFWRAPVVTRYLSSTKFNSLGGSPKK